MKLKSLSIFLTGIFIILCSFVLLPQQARAWGNEGHEVTALVAFQLLTPKAKAKVLEILGSVPITKASTWPDDLKRPGKGCVVPGLPGCSSEYRPETSNWHFVDMPLEKEHYDPAADCKNSRSGDCIIAAIEDFKVILARQNTSSDEQKRKLHDALSFIIHLAGDLHQPLHCADNHDGGGNSTLVTWDGEPVYPWGDIWNLHSVWDSYLIDLNIAAMPEGKRDAKTYADIILSDVSKEERRYAQLKSATIRPDISETTVAWAEEAHMLAKTATYVLPAMKVKKSTRGKEDAKKKEIILLNSAYFDDNRPKVRQQLRLGGVRLARILNEALDK